jgi:hypothetical protein
MLVTASWLAMALLLQVSEPSVPILWAVTGAIIFGLCLGLISLLSLHLGGRGMLVAQNEMRLNSRERIEGLNQRLLALEAENRALLSETLQLRRLNDKFEIELELALAHIQEMDNVEAQDNLTE